MSPHFLCCVHIWKVGIRQNQARTDPSIQASPETRLLKGRIDNVGNALRIRLLGLHCERWHRKHIWRTVHRWLFSPNQRGPLHPAARASDSRESISRSLSFKKRISTTTGRPFSRTTTAAIYQISGLSGAAPNVSFTYTREEPSFPDSVFSM